MLRRFNRPPVRKAKSIARRPRLQVEALEDRCVPASTVTVSGGVLTITGDNTNQFIQINETNTPGTYNVIVFDTATSAVVPVSNTTPGGITSIVVNTQGGNDTVSLSGNTASGTTLSGNLTITGTGALTVLDGTGTNGENTVGVPTSNAAGFNVAGTTSISNQGGTGNLTVQVGGSGTSFANTSITSSDLNASITFNASAAVLGTLGITTGQSADSVILGDGTGGINVTGAITINGGPGSNTLTSTTSTLGGLTITNVGNISFTTDTITSNVFDTFTGANNQFALATSTVQGFVSLNVSNPNSTAADSVTVSGSNINNFLSVISGTGADSISVTTSTIGNNVGLDLGGAVLGGGNDSVALSGTFLGNVFTLGTGNANISIGTAAGATTIASYVSLNETGTSSVANVTIGSSTSTVNIGGFLSVITSGTQSTANVGSTSLTNLTIGVNGNGQTGASFGATFGTANETMTINGGSIGGNLFVTNSTGNLTFNLGNTSTTSVTGYVSLNETGSNSTITATVGSGTDTVNVGGFFSVIATGTAVGSTDSVVLNTGTSLGNSFGNIFNAASDTVTLNGVKIANGGSVLITDTGSSSTSLTNVSAPGNLTMNTGSGNAITTVTSSTFGGANITGSGGTESLTFDDDNFNGAVSITQGPGTDTFTVELAPPVDATPTQFFGPFSYRANSSTDTVTLGASPTDLAVFFNSASFTANGAATDSISFKTNAQFNGGSPTITGFGAQS